MECRRLGRWVCCSRGEDECRTNCHQLCHDVPCVSCVKCQIVTSCATTCPVLGVSSVKLSPAVPRRALCWLCQVCCFSWLTEFGSCSGQLYIVGCLFGGAEGIPRRILQKCVQFEKNKTKWKGYFWNFGQQWQWLCAAVPSLIRSSETAVAVTLCSCTVTD